MIPVKLILKTICLRLIITPCLFRTAAIIFIIFIALQPSISQEYTQQKKIPGQPLFKIDDPDYTTSPFTGLTRKHWVAAATYLLGGAFSYIDNIDDPMQFPKQLAKAYPRNPGQVATEKLEGICRTLFIAAPLLKENPLLEINNTAVAAYYRHHIISFTDSTHPAYIQPRAKNGGPSQTLVELGALSVSLFVAPEVLWQPLSQLQKDRLATIMLSYGDGPTVPSNWKFFNIFILSFFKQQGYTVNEQLLTQYLGKCLEHYKGDGWYNDAPAYDYYSMWAFQMYAPLWAKYFGNKYYPAYAQKFINNFGHLKNNYPYLFSRKGEMIMWGRSIAYRFAAAVPFPLMGWENNTDINYGWMRRIASGTLLQFLKNPGFMDNNIPSLGFYGAFAPAVQPYSCRGSVFWMGKLFMGLLISPDNPFWTATENEGAWENKLNKKKVYNKFQKGSNILITNYPGIGASEIRAWCHVKHNNNWELFRASENYNRLSYNSAFPWQADSVNGVTAMNYIFKNATKNSEWEPLRLYTFKKFEKGVYFRDAVLENNENVQLQLADIPLPNGILRIDRIKTADSMQVRLGHYALPALQGNIKKTSIKRKGHEINIISNGVYQLAMVPLTGWNKTYISDTKDVHPEANESAVINTESLITGNKSPRLYVTLMLWKKAGEKWKKKELLPVKKIKETGSGILIQMAGGRKKIIYFN